MNRLIAKLKRHAISTKGSKIASDPTTTTLDADPLPLISTSDSSIQGPAKQGLNTLPPEIRRYLLSTLEILQLKLLVHASATFHQQYILDRRYLLCTCLERTLGSVTVDAHAAHLFAAQRENTARSTEDFLKCYGENIARRRLLLVDMLAEEEAVSMAAFQFRYIETLVKDYARWMLANLDEAKGVVSGPHGCQQIVALTSTETMRVTRAIYRFRILCHLAGPSNKPSWISRDHQDETIQTFLDTLEPWEVEELFSFYQYAHDVYDKVFKDIRWDLHPDNPKFNDQGRPPTPDGAFDLDGPNREMYLEGTILRGLPLLHTVLSKSKGREHLVSTMQQHITTSYIPFNALEGVLGETQQALRRQGHTSKHEQMQDTPLIFRGDGEPNAPPLAWTTIWGGTYSDLYGWYISDEMRQWGYIFWDAETLGRTGGIEVLMRQWEDCWDDDPRLNLL